LAQEFFLEVKNKSLSARDFLKLYQDNLLGIRNHFCGSWYGFWAAQLIALLSLLFLCFYLKEIPVAFKEEIMK